jgi:hypothetical protein
MVPYGDHVTERGKTAFAAFFSASKLTFTQFLLKVKSLTAARATLITYLSECQDALLLLNHFPVSSQLLYSILDWHSLALVSVLNYGLKVRNRSLETLRVVIY